MWRNMKNVKNVALINIKEKFPAINATITLFPDKICLDFQEK